MTDTIRRAIETQAAKMDRNTDTGTCQACKQEMQPGEGFQATLPSMFGEDPVTEFRHVIITSGTGRHLIRACYGFDGEPIGSRQVKVGTPDADGFIDLRPRRSPSTEVSESAHRINEIRTTLNL